MLKRFFSFITNQTGKAAINRVVVKSDVPSLPELQEAAIQGYPEAQAHLGYYYYMGYRTIQQDYLEAFRWFSLAAEQGLAEAQFRVGCMYYAGQGVPQDWQNAAYWFEKAAEQGDAMAQYNLAVLHSEDRGIEKNLRLANHWLQVAAERGLAEAQYDLGLYYYKGIRLFPKGYRKAFYWFEKAAIQGHLSAQNNLGLMYASGFGVPQNFQFAYQWACLAAVNGDGKACKLRDKALSHLTASQIKDAQEWASNWYLKAHSSIALTVS